MASPALARRFVHSPWFLITYYTRNRRRVIPVLAILIFAVFGISMAGALTGTITESASANLRIYEKVVWLAIGDESHIIPGRLEASLAFDPRVRYHERVYLLNTYYPSIVGRVGGPIFFVTQGAMAPFLDQTGMTLAEGRLPAVGQAEVALNRPLATARGLKIGDVLDSKTDTREYLRDRFTVVGILDGSRGVNVGSREYIPRSDNYRSANPVVLVVPQPGQERTLSEELAAGWRREDVNVWERGRAQREYDKDMGNLDYMLWSINGVVTLVLSLAVGLLNIIFYMQRMTEIGTLAALGHSRSFLIRRALWEAMLVTITAWVLGLFLSEGIYHLLNLVLFDGRMALTVFTRRTIALTVPIPVLVGLFSGFTVVWQLMRLDPLRIIERRD